MINHRNKQNYRFRTWKFRDRCHLKGGVRQGCFLSLILNYLIQYLHFHSLYITSHYYAKFKENPCVGTDARPPFQILINWTAHHIELLGVFFNFKRIVYNHTVETLIRHRVMWPYCLPMFQNEMPVLYLLRYRNYKPASILEFWTCRIFANTLIVSFKWG